ncbi:MAG: hypothetical protein JWO52_6647 [Gammaproteobacteria bacterium]|nr:hypothetical protein [Gammaproteobacteria bacterium]
MWSPKGRGVFALQSFQASDVVEICPVIVFECPYDDLPAEPQEYVFDWSDLDSSAGKNMQAIAMGCPSAQPVVATPVVNADPNDRSGHRSVMAPYHRRW